MSSQKSANPAPLGLFGFGMTTVLLNLANMGLYPLDSMILAMGLVYGGLAQILAGAMEFKNGNTFGTVAFSSYGLFWWSLVLLILLPQSFSNVHAPTNVAMASYFFMWGLFTLLMFFGTLKSNRTLQAIFALLTLLFFLLVATELSGNAALRVVTGAEGVITGLTAFYLAVAEVLNEALGRKVLPV